GIDRRQHFAERHRIADVAVDAPELAGHRGVQHVAVLDSRPAFLFHRDLQRPARDRAGLDQHGARPETPRQRQADERGNDRQAGKASQGHGLLPSLQDLDKVEAAQLA
ncbi:hypothetical protein RZS08_34400, partial [Arthrospira platensis SPKY1]|nr:hypothetical protein [Arthrospira platensis SPKY1]